MPLFWELLAANWARTTLTVIGLSLLALGFAIEQRRQLLTGEMTEADLIYTHAPGLGCILAGSWLLATAAS